MRSAALAEALPALSCAAKVSGPQSCAGDYAQRRNKKNIASNMYTCASCELALMTLSRCGTESSIPSSAWLLYGAHCQDADGAVIRTTHHQFGARCFYLKQLQSLHPRGLSLYSGRSITKWPSIACEKCSSSELRV